MTTRVGWTFNGHHYTRCASARMGRPLFTCHRDGVRMNERDWHKSLAADRAADRAAAAAGAAPPSREPTG